MDWAVALFRRPEDGGEEREVGHHEGQDEDDQGEGGAGGGHVVLGRQGLHLLLQLVEAAAKKWRNYGGKKIQKSGAKKENEIANGKTVVSIFEICLRLLLETEMLIFTCDANWNRYPGWPYLLSSSSLTFVTSA